MHQMGSTLRCLFQYADADDLRIAAYAYFVKHASKAAVVEGRLRPTRDHVEMIRSKVSSKDVLVCAL